MTQHYEDQRYEDSSVAVVDEQPALPTTSVASAKAPALRNATRWAAKGGLAILDQALISGSNFLVSICLARWLMPEQYGSYALAFSISLLLTFLYQSLLLEPMAVFSGGAYRRSLRGYLGALLGIHFWISGFGLIALGIATVVAYKRGGTGGLPGALLGVTLASPCVLLFSLSRRAYYMKLAPARAAVGAAIYCAVVTGGLFVVYREGWLSPFMAFALMATGALFTSMYLLFHVRKTLTADEPGPKLRQTWDRHWNYGRWALATSAATWIPYYMYYPLLSAFKDLTQAGQLRALMNLALPLEQSYTALACLFLPLAARLHGDQGTAGARTLTRRITLLYVGGAIVYWLAVIPLKGPVFHLLYRGKYLEVAYLLPYVAAETILWSAAFGPTIVLRGMESPASVFYARCAASVLSLAVGVPLTLIYGLWGCVLGIVFSNAAALLFCWYLLRRKFVLSANTLAAAAQAS
jgi:O-antigen/teichoic acid export membrane protein